MTSSRLFIPIVFVIFSCYIQSSSSVVIDLPFGLRTMGVAHVAGSNYVFSDAATGNLYLIDINSGLITSAVRAPPGRISLGVYASNKHFFAAGVGPFAFGNIFDPLPVAAIYVYDILTGQPTITCTIPDGKFIGDVYGDSKYAYSTDGQRAVIYQVDLMKYNNSNCVYKELQLPKESFEGEGIRGNGIVGYKNGLIVVNTVEQTLYYYNLKNNHVSRFLPINTLPEADGLEIAFDKKTNRQLLYVAQNRINAISVWALSISKSHKVKAKRVRTIMRPNQFRTPTTIAVNNNRLVGANFDFSTNVTIPVNGTFTLVSIRLD